MHVICQHWGQETTPQLRSTWCVRQTLRPPWKFVCSSRVERRGAPLPKDNVKGKFKQAILGIFLLYRIRFIYEITFFSPFMIINKLHVDVHGNCIVFSRKDIEWAHMHACGVYSTRKPKTMMYSLLVEEFYCTGNFHVPSNICTLGSLY